MNGHNGQSVAEVYQDFIFAKTAEGVSDITIRNYHQHLHNISKYLDIEMNMRSLSKRDLEDMICAMRAAGLAHNSISTYVRVLRTFLNWCQKEGRANLTIPNMKDKETVKETYSDEELSLLLQKPDANCSFPEYRNWVIINFLLNSGCRAATVRNIQNRDVDLGARQIVYRHTKNGKVQTVPLCSKMVSILRDYMTIRKGEPVEYLFCDQYGGMLSENALRLAIAKLVDNCVRQFIAEANADIVFLPTIHIKHLCLLGGHILLSVKFLALSGHCQRLADAFHPVHTIIAELFPIVGIEII